MIDIWTVLLCCCVLCLYVLWHKTSRDATLPPGPPTIPFIGNLNLKQDNLLDTFQDYRLKYGDVFSLILGSQTMVVVNGLNSMIEVFIKHGDVTSERPDTFITREITHNKGIVFSSGPLWKEHKAFTLGTLRDLGFGKRSLESKIIEEVEVLMKIMGEKNGQPFNIRGLLTLCVSNITCSITFGQRYEHTDTFFQSLLDKMHENITNANLMFLSTIFPFLQHVPGDPFRIKRAIQNSKEITEHMEHIIKEHEETYDKNNLRDFVDIFLKRMKSDEDNPESTFDYEQLQRILTDLFIAGSETNATTLLWFIVLMINHPEVQDSMRAEINDVIGISRYPCIDDRVKMPYTEAVLHEVHRFGSVAPLASPHGLTKDLDYKGHIIPKNCLLVPNLHSVLHDPEIFEDPQIFRPTRFLDSDGKLMNVDKVLAFGLGKRICLGESLARMELFLFTTTIVQRFKLLPADANNMPSTKGKLRFTFAPEEYSFCAVTV